jgi:hypothetical protein
MPGALLPARSTRTDQDRDAVCGTKNALEASVAESLAFVGRLAEKSRPIDSGLLIGEVALVAVKATKPSVVNHPFILLVPTEGVEPTHS